MGNSSKSYLTATRHPWSCFLFLMPFLAAYEGGVFWLGGRNPDELRNGADAWARWALDKFALGDWIWLPPLLIAVFFFSWSIVRVQDMPEGWLGVLSGMALESVAFALGLWVLGRTVLPFLEGAHLIQIPPVNKDESLRQVITFVGAGIYEEVLFRLVLMTALRWLFMFVSIPDNIAGLLAVIGSAFLFSLAHHVGPFGEEFDKRVFVFRLLAGVYFALLYQWRGFGISVGAHACYDVMVGVTLG